MLVQLQNLRVRQGCYLVGQAFVELRTSPLTNSGAFNTSASWPPPNWAIPPILSMPFRTSFRLLTTTFRWPVTQLTHIAEDLLSPLRQDKDRWPHAELNQYVGWLRELANPTYDKNEVEAVLADARRLEKEIAAGVRA